MDMQFQGLDELMHELDGMERDTEKSKKDALEAGGKVMQKSAKDIVRVRTGNLKGHIELSDVENDQIEVYVDNQGKAYYGYMLSWCISISWWRRSTCYWLFRPRW